MSRQLNNISSSRRKLLYNFIKEQADRGKKDSLQSGSTSSTTDVNNSKAYNLKDRFQSESKSSTPDANKSKLYKLREPSNIKYFEDENDTDDFSSDYSEYNPSPKLPDSQSTSSLGTDLQDMDNISYSNSNTTKLQENDSRSTSSLGGDSLVIDHLLHVENIPHSPSTISNLSTMLSDTDFVASSTIIYKTNYFNSPKKQEKIPKLVDTTLKTVNENEQLTLRHRAAITNLSTVEDLEKTLTPIKTSGNCFDTTLTNSELIEKEQDIPKNSDTSYEWQEYKIEIIIESEPPEIDRINEDNNSSGIEDVVTANKHRIKEKSERSNIEKELATNSVKTLDQQNIIYCSPKNNNETCPNSINQTLNENYERKLDVERIFLDDPEEILIKHAELNNNETVNLDPLDLPDREKTDSVNVDKIFADKDMNKAVTNDKDNHLSESENHDQLQAKKLTRKRTGDPSEWRDNKNKKLKNSGQAYEGARNKKHYAKKNILPNCVCSKGCGLKFSTEDRKDLHTNFYKLANREFQWQYITRHVKSIDIKKITLNRTKNRTQTLKYYLPLNDEEIPVCKTFFLNTLSITEQMIYTAFEKSKRDESLTDKRGKHQNRPHQMKLATEDIIKYHINLFPKVESHYTRKETKREYLSESLNISKMYRLYKLWFTEQNYPEDVEMASKRQYERVFNTNYNYSFFKPKKDQCTLCSQYNQAESIDKEALEENYRKHLRMKESVRKIKNEEKAKLNKEDAVVAIYDLQKVLTVPQSEVSVFHYKRKYPIYNFTVFDALNKRGFCYVWQAQIGKKGSTEIGSCLLQFIKSVYEKHIRKIILYSDGCYGQNKNRFIFALYLYAAITYQVDITHRFFVSGHSQNEGDSMHACIERGLKNKVLYTPDQVYSIIMNAKVSGDKYMLKEMQQSEILDIKRLVEPKRWFQDKTGQKVRWADVMEVSVSHTKPNCFLFKYDFDEEYIELDYEPSSFRKRRGQNQVFKKIESTELKPAYDKPLPISKALYNDLMTLCNSQAIPLHYQPFYKNLTYDAKSGEDGDSD